MFIVITVIVGRRKRGCEDNIKLNQLNWERVCGLD